MTALTQTTDRGLVQTVADYAKVAASRDLSPQPHATKIGRLFAGAAGEKWVCCGVVDLVECGVVDPPYRFLAFMTGNHGSATTGVRLLCSNSWDEDSFVTVQSVSSDWTGAGFTVPSTDPITIANFPDITAEGTADKGEFPTALATDGGGITLFGHAAFLNGSSGQSQWRATSTAAQPLVFTYRNAIRSSHSQQRHTGYANYSRDGGALVGHGLVNELSPLQGARWYSVDGGEHWQVEHPLHQNAWPDLYGHPTLELLSGWQYLPVRGQSWAIGRLRTRIGAGGALGNAKTVLFRVSQDGRRPVGKPLTLIEPGGTGAWDEDDAGTGPSFALVDPYQPDTLIVIYGGRGNGSAAGDTGSFGAVRLDFRGSGNLTPAFEPQAGYEALAALLGPDGTLMPAGPTPAQVVSEIHGGTRKALPDDWQFTGGSGAGIAYAEYNDNQAAGVRLTAGVGDAMLSYGIGTTTGARLHPLGISEAWIELFGWRGSDDDLVIDVGFRNSAEAGLTSTRNAFVRFTGDDTQTGIYAKDNGATTTYLRPGHSQLINRWANRKDLSVGLIRVPDSTASSPALADNWCVVAMSGDQPIMAANVSAGLGFSGVMHPFIRVARGDAAVDRTVTIEHIKIRLSGRH